MVQDNINHNSPIDDKAQINEDGEDNNRMRRQ